MRDIYRRAQLDDSVKKKIHENVKKLLKDKKPEAEEDSSQEGSEPDEGGLYLFDASARNRVALDFDTKKEYQEYIKTHDINPETKIHIKSPSKETKKTEDKVVKKKVEEPVKKTETPKQEQEQSVSKPLREETRRPGNLTGLPTSHPARQPIGEERRIAIKDLALEKFGIDAKDFNTHKIHKSQISENVKVWFPDGTEKYYSQLSKDEKKRVEKAIDQGLVASKGLVNYDSVSIGAFKSNMDVNLKHYDNPDVEEEIVTDEKPATKEDVDNFSSTLREGGRTLLKKHSKAMSSTTRPIAEKFVDDISDSIQEGVRDGSLANVKQSDLDELMRENVKRLLHQEIETRRRSLGDHGIRHVAANARNAVQLLTELQKSDVKITGKQKLMAITVMADHDIGYTVGEAATDTSKGGQHKKNSSDLVESEKDRYDKVFGEEEGTKMRNIVLTHDDPVLNWDGDPVMSAVRLADNTSLFGKDKVQDLFFRSPKATELACKMYLAASGKKDDTKLQEKIKEQMHDVVDEGDFESSDREAMHAQIDELSEGGFSSSKDILSRFSGRLDAYKYDTDSKTMNVNMKYSSEGQIIDKLFGEEVACRQFDKFAKDLGGSPVKGKRGNTLFKNPDGSLAFQLNIDGFDNKETPQVSAMKDFQKKTARFEFQTAASLVASPPKAKEKDIEKAKKAMEISKEKFTKQEWKALMKAFDSGKDLEELSKKLGAWPILRSELAFLEGKTASRMATQIMLASIAERVAFDVESRRGQQTQRKDKDLMSDTGGISKHRTSPNLRPPRTDVSRRYRTKNKTPEERDPDVDVKESKVASIMNVIHPLDVKVRGVWGDIPEDNYHRKVYRGLMSILEGERNISEKAFVEIDKLMMEVDLLIRTNDVEDIIQGFIAKGARPEMCAEEIHFVMGKRNMQASNSKTQMKLAQMPRTLREAVIRG